jgi:UDP-N-acetylglucosamine 2-epimerase (non-hydrolysing)
MKTIIISYGTRPEYIKVKSLIDNLYPVLHVKTLFTGQHTDLLSDAFANYHIDIANHSGNRLNDIITSILSANYIFSNIDYVLVQGDTTSALAVALSAFNHNIKVIHLEAGLRTYDTSDPYPEELNRQMISRIASVNLCPTNNNALNLIKEKVSGDVHVTGNTGLDNIDRSGITYQNKVLITLHRRDNHALMAEWFTELERLANMHPDTEFIIPIHPNPNVTKHKSIFKKVKVIDPIPHSDILNIIKECKFMISDSGGLQEEGSFLRKKIIICRKTTERPEVLEHYGELCTHPSQLEKIYNKFNNDYIVDKPCPFGDGNAWVKIKKIMKYI